MDESCTTVSLEGSLEREWRENILPVGGLGGTLITCFGWKKKRPLVNIYINSWATANVLDDDQGLKGKRLVRQGAVG